MFNFWLGKHAEIEPDECIESFYSEEFTKESEFLKRARREIIEMDKLEKSPKLLVNNNNLKVSWRNSTILKKKGK
jgi:hypothetical protein